MAEDDIPPGLRGTYLLFVVPAANDSSRAIAMMAVFPNLKTKEALFKEYDEFDKMVKKDIPAPNMTLYAWRTFLNWGIKKEKDANANTHQILDLRRAKLESRETEITRLRQLDIQIDVDDKVKALQAETDRDSKLILEITGLQSQRKEAVSTFEAMLPFHEAMWAHWERLKAWPGKDRDGDARSTETWLELGKIAKRYRYLAPKYFIETPYNAARNIIILVYFHLQSRLHHHLPRISYRNRQLTLREVRAHIRHRRRPRLSCLSPLPTSLILFIRRFSLLQRNIINILRLLPFSWADTSRLALNRSLRGKLCAFQSSAFSLLHILSHTQPEFP